MRLSVQVRGSEVMYLGQRLVEGVTVVVRPEDGSELVEGEWVPHKRPTRKQQRMLDDGQEIELDKHPVVLFQMDPEGTSRGGLRALVTNEKGHPHVMEISLLGRSFRSTKPTFDRFGKMLSDVMVTASGVLKEGLYHFDLTSERCKVYFVSKDTLVTSSKKRAEKNKSKRLVKERVRALRAFEDSVKEGRWRSEDPRYKVLILDEYLRFPDRSGITLPLEGDLNCQVFAPPYGPEDALASLWTGWNPSQELTVDTAPPALRDNVKRALDLLTVMPSGQIHLLPKSGERSPILKLGESGNGVMVFRTIGLERLGLGTMEQAR